MTLDQASSPDTTETPIDGTETPSSGEVGLPPASPGSALTRGLVTIRRWTRRCLAAWRAILAAVLVVAAMGVAVGLFFIQYRPDRQIGDAAAKQAIEAASDGGVALLSYSYDTLDRDFATAKSHLTGNFLASFDKIAQEGVAPTAREGQLTATAKVLRAAVSELHPDSAVVLVFLEQTTTSKKSPPQPVKTASGVLVTLTKVKGSWLIAKFDPLL
jgi:Mce-associated membrane protein